MNSSRFSLVGVAVWVTAGVVVSARAQTLAPVLPAANSVILTVLPTEKAAASATVDATDVSMKHGGDVFRVTNLQAFGDSDVIELVIAIDDDTPNLGARLTQLRDWVRGLPPNILTGVAYIRNGTADIAISPTPNRDHAVGGIRAPAGSRGTNFSVVDGLANIVGRWPVRPTRHEILLISDGAESTDSDQNNGTLVQNGIARLQQAGVVLYTLFAGGNAGASNVGGENSNSSGARRTAGTYDPVNASPAMQTQRGIANLTQETEATGGWLWTEGNSTPANFTPCLDELTVRLQHQYRLTYDPPAKLKAGEETVKIQVATKGVMLTAPSSVFIR